MIKYLTISISFCTMPNQTKSCHNNQHFLKTKQSFFLFDNCLFFKGYKYDLLKKIIPMTMKTYVDNGVELLQCCMSVLIPPNSSYCISISKEELSRFSLFPVFPTNYKELRCIVFIRHPAGNSLVYTNFFEHQTTRKILGIWVMLIIMGGAFSLRTGSLTIF